MFERFAISDSVDEIEDEPFIPDGVDMSLVINEDKEEEKVQEKEREKDEESEEEEIIPDEK